MTKPLIAISSKQALIFACFLVAYEFLTYIANDMIMPGMIQVVHEFRAPESLIPTSLTLYILGGASLQLILGPISDAYGRRPMMLLGACLFFFFTLLIACSLSMNQFLGARFFQGMGLCFITVIGYATIQEIFGEMDAIRLIAIMTNAAILAPLLGPLLGAIIIHYASWRVIFFVIAGIAVLVLWGLWRFMPEPIGQLKKDGTLILKSSFSLRDVIKNYWNLLSNPIFSFSALAMGVAGIPCVAWIALAPIIFITKGQLTPVAYGLWQIPVFAATILGNWCLHCLSYKFSLKSMAVIGALIMMSGLVLMALLPYVYGEHYLLLLPGIMIYFFALSVINAPLNRYCLFSTKVSTGTASALVSLSVMITGALGIEVTSIFYRLQSNLNFALCSLVWGVIMLLFLCLAFNYRQRP